MTGTDIRRASVLLLLLLLAAPPLAAQAVRVTAGDPGAATTVLRGRAACGTDPAAMSSADGTSYRSYSVSELAALVPEVGGSVPNPMGKRATTAASEGLWGVTVRNPARELLTVTAVAIDDNARALFGAITGVQPATGWTATTDVVSWIGSVTVPAGSARDFLVRIGGRSLTAGGPVTLRATTSAGTLTHTGFATAQRNGNAAYPGLPFVVGTAEAVSGNSANGGAVAAGATTIFTVRVAETENLAAIPVGTTLTVTLPAGWSAVSAATGQASFANPTVTQAPGCNGAWSIATTTTATIQNAARPFRFQATAPVAPGAVGLYPFTARLENPVAVPPIATVTEFTQEVKLTATAGVRAGLSSPEVRLSVPNPMGSTRSSRFGIAIANPFDTAYTVSQIDLVMTGGEPFFKAVWGIRPATGWSWVSPSALQWTGTLVIDPHDAADLVLAVQANARDGVNRTLRATVNGSLTRDAVTSEGGSGMSAASLVLLRAGGAAVHAGTVSSGAPATFHVVVRESAQIALNPGVELRVVVPAGWTGVGAAPGQPGFGTPVVVPPGPGAGDIRVPLTSALSGGERTFTFSATAPSGLDPSLFVFPASLSGPESRSTADLVVRVGEAAGGLLVEHLSPPIAATSMTQIQAELVASAAADSEVTAALYDFAGAAWEPLAFARLGAAPGGLAGAVRGPLDAYFDEPLASPTKHLKLGVVAGATDNHRLDEDLVAFHLTYYQVTGTSLAPALTAPGRVSEPMLGLAFATDAGAVDLVRARVQVTGTAPLADVALVHFFPDLDCDGAIDPGAPEPVPAVAPGADASATFDAAPGFLLSFAAGAPACAVIAFDLTAAAGPLDVVAAAVTGPFDLAIAASAAAPSPPFPSASGYPIVSAEALVPGGPPLLSLEKSFAPPLPPSGRHLVGTTLTYSIAVTNIGQANATNLTVVDDLDPAWAPYTGVIVPLDGGSLCLPPSCLTPRVTWPLVATLAGNASQTRVQRFRATLPTTLADGTVVANTGAASSAQQPAGTPSNRVVVPVCVPAITIVKTLPATPTDYAVGDSIEWTITLTNPGSNCPATGLVVGDVVDVTHLDAATLAFDPPTGVWDAGTQTYRWSLASLDPGASVDLRLSGRILPAAQGRILCNLASVVWDQAVSALPSDPPGGTCIANPVLAASCIPANLGAPRDLKLVRGGASGRDDLLATWSGGSVATEQHLNRVDRKTDIGSARRPPAGIGSALYSGPVAATTVFGEVSGGASEAYYQAFRACGNSGDDEGAY